MAVVQLEAVLRPADLGEALDMLRAAGGTARLMAGGTDLVLHPPAGVTSFIDLSDLGLDGVSADDGTLRMGAMATLTDILEHPGVTHLGRGAMVEMLTLVGSPLLRNVATIGGHLARGRLSDIVPVLLVLDAEVTVFDGEQRTVPLAEYYRLGMNHSATILTEVAIPAPPADSAAAFVKLSTTAFDLAMLNGAAFAALDKGTVATARVAVGETPWLAARVPGAEAALDGRSLDEAAIGAAAVAAADAVPTGTDQRASAEYRTHLVEVVVRRALTVVRDRLEGRSG